MNEHDVRQAFRSQAAACTAMGSPFMALLCEVLAEWLDRGSWTGQRILDWQRDPNEDALQMRVTGGLHALVRKGLAPELAALYPPRRLPPPKALGAAVRAAIRSHDAFLFHWLDSPPQTNEVGRSAVLMAGMLTVAAATGKPLALRELGSSAGLNLRLDRYAYQLGGLAVGPPDAPLTLTPEWVGIDPPAAPIRVANRRGVDRAPLDVRDRQTRERLLAFVWADRPERLTRLAAALDDAMTDPPPVDRGDAAAWAEANVVPEPGVATVVYHSIVHQYFPEATKIRLAEHMAAMGARATADAPLAWLRMEVEDPAQATTVPPTLRLRMWPGGEDRLLARVHPHGAKVVWLAESPATG
jgi:hypothetical protein